jgi:Putative transmembrane protein (PGPGW)
VAPTRPAGRRGDGGLPDTRERFLVVHPLEAPLDSVRISASLPLARAVLGRHAGDLVDVASRRRTAVTVAGSMVVVVGLALLVLPGPGLLLLTAGPCPARHRVRLGPALADAAPRARQAGRPPGPAAKPSA